MSWILNSKLNEYVVDSKF